MQNQQNQQFETPSQAPPKKKGSLFNKIIILVVLLVIIGGVVFIVMDAKSDKTDTGDNSTARPPVTDNGEPEPLSSSAKLIIFILVGAVIIVVGYLVVKGLSGNKSSDVPKVPVAPDRAEELFIQNFSLRYKIECVYDGEKKLYKPADSNAVSLINKHPYFHTATGDNFLLMEIEVNQGKRQGIHMVILPIDKGEETIKGGWYRIETNTPKHVFALNRGNYPMSSMADKSDRMKLAMLDRTNDADAQKEVMKSMNTPQPNTISTPLDAYGEPQPYQQQRRPLPRKRAPTRYTGRRY